MAQDTISVLLVEDNPTDALLVSEELRGSASPRFVLSQVERLAPALQRLATETFNVVLLDLGLPDSQELDTLHAMCRQAPETPIVVLTGLDDESRAILAVQSGAQDYLTKREVQGHLIRAIRYSIERKRGELERKRLESQLMRNQRLESIGTLAGGIAHDLNNLLTPIIMGVHLLESCQDPLARKIAKPLQASATTASELVKQVLIFARGGQNERSVLEVGPLLDRLVKLLKQVIPRNIEIHTSMPDGLWPVSGDPTEMHQIVLNLCVNARDAMPTGGQLSLSAENTTVDASYASVQPKAKPGPYVVIRVGDTGTGISPEVMDRMFEPFFTTKELGKGTGLGLATVMGIVQSYGGFVEVKSDVGVGTTFIVYLPAVPTAKVVRDAGQREELPRGRGQMVLIVDDEATVREMLRATLETFGYRTYSASDGAEAVKVFAAHRGEIHAIIVDMMMPVMDGAAAIKAIWQIDAKVPIISASGLRERTRVMEAMQGQVQAFLPKPYSVEQLLTTLHGILASRDETS